MFSFLPYLSFVFQKDRTAQVIKRKGGRPAKFFFMFSAEFLYSFKIPVPGNISGKKNNAVSADGSAADQSV